MRKTGKGRAAFLLLGIILLQSGCKNAVEKRPLLWYTAYSFPFEMTTSSPAGVPYRMSGERTPARVTLTVREPTALAGLVVTYENGNCTMAAGETVIPLTREAAAGLTSLLDALLVSDLDGDGSDPGARLGSTPDGETTVAFTDFTLTLDGNGLPAKVETSEREAVFFVQDFPME